MVDYHSIEQQLSETLSLQRRPVAVKFQETPPAGLPKFTGTMPSGCSFWRLAAEGRTFYTVPVTITTARSGAIRITFPSRRNAPRNSTRRSRS